MTRFVRKAPTLEAIQWSGSNWHAVREFAEKHGDIDAVYVTGNDLYVRTMPGEPKGDVLVMPGYWVIAQDDTSGWRVASDQGLHKEWTEVPDDSD